MATSGTGREASPRGPAPTAAPQENLPPWLKSLPKAADYERVQNWRVTRAYVAGFGTAGSLLAAASVLFVMATAVVAYRGWPQIAYAGPRPALVLAHNDSAYGVGPKLAAATRGRPTAIVAPSTVTAAVTPTRPAVHGAVGSAPSHTSAPTTLVASSSSGATRTVASSTGTANMTPVKTPSTPTSTTSPTCTSCAAPTASVGAGVAAATGSLGAGVSATGKQLGNTVGAVSSALAGQLSTASPAVGGLVAGVGQALGNTVTQVTGTVGGAVAGTGQLLGGLLGSH